MSQECLNKSISRAQAVHEEIRQEQRNKLQTFFKLI